jgi:hypothetical protein
MHALTAASAASCTLAAVESAARTAGQGLPLVHFSAQPEPFSSLKPRNTPNASHIKCSSPEVDECKPMPLGARRARQRRRATAGSRPAPSPAPVRRA